jgi:VIT1/CCC1 family predicted Fe2+/Mn2+ transporter
VRPAYLDASKGIVQQASQTTRRLLTRRLRNTLVHFLAFISGVAVIVATKAVFDA